MGQGVKAIGKGRHGLGDAGEGDAVGGAEDRDHIGAAETVMLGGDDQIEPVGAPARVLGLDDERTARLGFPGHDGQRQGGAAGGDPDIRPGRAVRLQNGIGRRVAHPRLFQRRGPFVEGGSPADTTDLDVGRTQALDGLGQPQRLILDSDPTVRDDPEPEGRRVVACQIHSTLRIS